MAINPETQYPGKIAPSSPQYPYGAARNITTPGDGTGTPWDAALVNDIFGFQQALLGRAGLVPSGNPEEVGSSQYLDAVEKIIRDEGNFATPEEFGADYVDDTAALDAAFASGRPVKLGNKTYQYLAASHVGAAQLLSQVIYGDNWTINCVGPVQFDMPDDFDWSGGRFVSDDVFAIDPAVPSGSAPGSVMLISNAVSGVTPITKGKLKVDFAYSAAADGSTRGEGFIRIAGDTPLDIDVDTVMHGAVLPFWASSEGGDIRGRFRFTNYETGVLGRSGPGLDLDIVAINTPAQRDNYRATGAAFTKNGKDAILIETSGSVNVTESVNINMVSLYAIERGAYLQTIRNGVIKGFALGSDVGKCTDGSRNLEVHAYAHFPADTGTESRYAWQVYGGPNGATEDIDIWPTLQNRTGVAGNKECCSVLGEVNRIVVHEPYGYDCGNGIWLGQDAGGVFTPKIEDLTFKGGRLEGPGEQSAANGAITGWFTAIPAGAYIRNVIVDGMSSMPSSAGQETFSLNQIEGYAKFLNCHVDGKTNSWDYGNEVVINNPLGTTQIDSWEVQADSRRFPFVYPRAILRTYFGNNTTTNTVIATVPTPPGNPANVEVEILARHNGQASSSYITYRSVLMIGTTDTGGNSINVAELNLTNNHTVDVSYDATTGEITLNHTSTTPLGFDDSVFYARLRSTTELTV